MGPLSAKQHREYLKLDADEQRKNIAFAQEQQRKDQLHQLKLKEAGAKASQGITHKEENHAMKLAEGTIKVPRINRQKLGLPSMNPLAGSEVLSQGQKRLPGMIPKGTDTVPAMLTPGEAVIPAPAAQNPKNKKAIKRMVDEGRKKNKVQGYADGSINIKPENKGKFTRKADAADMSVQEYAQKVLAAPLGKYDPDTRKQANFARNATQWHADGTTEVAYYQDGSVGVSFLDRLQQGLRTAAPGLGMMIDKVSGVMSGEPGIPKVQTLAPPVTEAPKVDMFQEWKNATMGQETNYGNNPNTWNRNNQGALGLYQLTEDTFNGLKRNKQIPSNFKFDNKEHNTIASEVLLEDTWKRAKGDPAKASAIWYGGPKAVDKEGNIVSYKDLKNPNAPDTVQYSQEVVGRMPQPSVPPLPTGREVMIAKQDLATSTNPAVRRKAEAVLAAANQGVPTLAETRQNVFPAGGVDPNVRKDLGVELKTVTPPPNIPNPRATPSNITETVPPVTPNEVPQVETPVPEQDTRALDAMVAGFSKQVAPQIEEATKQASNIPDPVERKSFLEKFISSIYGGEKSLFNEQDLARFAVVAAGGMLAGGSTGGSLRFAARDVLASADKRATVQGQQAFEREKIKAVDDRTERNKLIDQGYEPANIEKYLKSRTITDLGNPRTTYSFKETGKQFTIDRGPQSGMVFQVVEATTKTGKGSGDTTLMVVDPRSGNKVPLSTFQSNAQKLGFNVVDYSSATHSPTAKANRVKEWVEKDANTIADQAIEQVYGASNVKGKPNTARANVPTSSAMGAQAASFFKSIGFEPSDSGEMLEGKNIMNVAVQDMINDQQTRKVKVTDITPYLSRSMITVRSGINPDLFKIGAGEKARVMPPEKIVQLDYLVKQATSDLGGGQTNAAAQQALYQRMATAWNNNPKLREQYAKPGPEESSFYMFMKDTLSKGLKQ